MKKSGGLSDRLMSVALLRELGALLGGMQIVWTLGLSSPTSAGLFESQARESESHPGD